MHDAAFRALPALAVVRGREIEIPRVKMSPSEQTGDSKEVEQEKGRRTLLNVQFGKIALRDIIVVISRVTMGRLIPRLEWLVSFPLIITLASNYQDYCRTTVGGLVLDATSRVSVLLSLLDIDLKVIRRSKED